MNGREKNGSRAPTWTPVYSLADLRTGDLLRGRNATTYVVTAVYGDHVVAVRTVELTAAAVAEWSVLHRGG